MRVFKYREAIPNSSLAEKKALDIRLRNHSKITIAALSTSTNIRLKVKYVFEADGTASRVPSGGSAQAVTDATVANPCVFTSTAHGYLVGDIVSVRGNRSPDPSVAATFVDGYAVEDGVITAVAADEFTINEFSTVGVAAFGGSATALYRGKEVDIQTVDLTSGTLTLLNFDFKLGFVRITRDDTGSTPTAGVLRIDATAAK
tara:strand:+ start:148 stop:753 length:606 start_codon:yes stop_codon:yes gene_type:complete